MPFIYFCANGWYQSHRPSLIRLKGTRGVLKSLKGPLLWYEHCSAGTSWHVACSKVPSRVIVVIVLEQSKYRNERYSSVTQQAHHRRNTWWECVIQSRRACKSFATA